MSKVFEALQRQLKHGKHTISNRDPLAAQVGAPDLPSGEAGNEVHPMTAKEVAESGEYDQAQVIGSPAGPRSNDGAIIPSLNRPFPESGYARTANDQINREVRAEEAGTSLQWKKP